MLECFEATFNITITEEEALRFDTLGKAYQIICSKLPKGQKKCLTAMAYYRLNRALCQNGKIAPSARVNLPEGINAKNFQKQLEDHAKLKLDFVSKESVGVTMLAYLQFVTWIAGPLLFDGFYAAITAMLIFFISNLLWRFSMKLDNRIWIFNGTMGDLSRKASEANVWKLVHLGAKWKESDVWASMTTIINDFTGYPSGKMTPETKFI